jgi:hypothetical protein
MYLEYLLSKDIIKVNNVFLEACDPLGLVIAKALKVYCNGYQPEIKKYIFTDNETGSSFCAGDIEEGRDRLKKLRFKFKFKNASSYA